MQVAVLSDIHSNHTALEACIAEAFRRQADAYIFLGDYTADLAYPRQTMQILYRLQKTAICYFIRGNKEDYCIDFRNNHEHGWMKEDPYGPMLYTYQNLHPSNLYFFEQLPIAKTISFKGLPPLTACHGSPYRANENLIPDDKNTFSIMEHHKNPLILCGHTHIQREIRHKGKTVLNPGSVGVPYYSGGKTQFLILHGSNHVWTHEFISLVYDFEKAIFELHESGLYQSRPYWCAITESILRYGTPSHGSVLDLAMELYMTELGSSAGEQWADMDKNSAKTAIPDKYMAQAVGELTGK